MDKGREKEKKMRTRSMRSMRRRSRKRGYEITATKHRKRTKF